MSHGLEKFSSGDTGFVSGNNLDAWHRLGTVLPADLTAEQVMKFARLGEWNVRKEPIHTNIVTNDGVSIERVAGKFVTLRTNPVTKVEEIIGGDDNNGIVGETYEPYQNESLTGYLQALTDESGAMFDTAGTMRGGADVFVTMKLPQTMLVGGVDALTLNIAVLNNHCGKRAITGLITPVRIVCANTQAAALGSAKSSFKIRHTSGAGGRVQLVREALGLTFKFIDAFQREANEMINEQLSIDTFKKVCGDIWKPAKDSAEGRGQNLALDRESALRELFLYSPTNENIRGTKWAGYQAIAEYLDHSAPVNGKTERAKAVNRAVRAIDGNVVVIKQKAFALLSA